MKLTPRFRILTATAVVAVLSAASAGQSAAQQSAFLMGLLSRDAAADGATNPLHGDFARAQLRHPRVFDARVNARHGIKKLFRERDIPYPAAEVFMRVFKRERILELWARPAGGDRFALLKEYAICALAGEIGPKRKQGDNQTPEGFYEIDSFNPNSEYLLSLHVDYPNASDRVLSDRSSPGGAIFIHGGCKTLGCIAITDEAIEELYWIAVEARSSGQERIPVHIFPSRLTDTELAMLEGAFEASPTLVDFWRNLQPGYLYFERNRVVPRVSVDARGRYLFTDAYRGQRVGSAGEAAATNRR
ncbi:MAG TPA: L,D-transpeptidase family protein [Longimicrobiales bacterium]|nr:L,D-transpeptidase family protein [Longimicrobiales bacterium]